MGNIVIFGAGEMATNLLMRFERQRKVFNDVIVGILDNDAKKRGRSMHGYMISSPDRLLQISFDYIVIACSSFQDIVQQLERDYFINKEIILSSRDYGRKKVCEYQFERNRERGRQFLPEQWSAFNLTSVVIYTAIIGNYDDLKVPSVINPNWKYICYSDNKSLKSEVWEIRYVENMNGLDAPLFVRLLKLCPHRLFPEYDTSIWVDASIQIDKDLSVLIHKYQDYSDMLFFPHPDRMCLFEEGAACIYLKKDSKERILYQMKQYIDEKYPFDNGLLCGGFLVRNHNKSNVIKTMEKWWSEVQGGSRRDQISLPYVLWRLDMPYDLVDLNCYKNEFFQVLQHKDCRR